MYRQSKPLTWLITSALGPTVWGYRNRPNHVLSITKTRPELFLVTCVSQHDQMRLFAVKFVLSYRQKYEPRSKFFIFEIFFLNIHHTKHNHDKHFFQWKCGRKEVLWNIFYLQAYRSTHKLQSLTAQISVKLFWKTWYMAMLVISFFCSKMCRK